MDFDAIRVLADELGSAEPVLRFLTKYLSMLPHRVDRIVCAGNQRDAAAMTNAVLSLKISSAMVGAVETEHHCQAIESLIRTYHFEDAVQTVPSLRHTAKRYAASETELISAAHRLLSE